LCLSPHPHPTQLIKYALEIYEHWFFGRENRPLPLLSSEHRSTMYSHMIKHITMLFRLRKKMDPSR
jgi:hypothetical protein